MAKKALDEGLVHQATGSVKRIWKASRPKFVMMLKNSGEFNSHARQAAINWLEMRDELMAGGASPTDDPVRARRRQIARRHRLA